MLTHFEQVPAPDEELRVAYTRGKGCSELAGLLATGEAVRVVDDVTGACLRARADVLVARKVLAFDLTDLAVPHGFDPDVPRRISAFVGTGPHSLLAGRLAARLGEAMALDVDLITAYTSPEERVPAGRALAEVSGTVGIEGRLVAAGDVSDVLADLGQETLLVLGAAGGGLLSRLFFGPGARLRARAPAGAVIVKAAPLRVFRRMVEPAYVASHLSVREADRLIGLPVVAVVAEGRFIGILRHEALGTADEVMTVSDVMEEGTAVSPLDPLEDFETAGPPTPMPVIDDSGVLVGTVWV